MKQFDFFAEETRLARLTALGDPLEKISKAIDFEMFRDVLNKAFHKEHAGPGGRPPYDYVMMFKILLLQQWNGISDDNAEFLINDRGSYLRFLGLSAGDKVPDAKTIWLYRENLMKSGYYEKLFDLFTAEMEKLGVITRNGSIVDASFVEAPKQRNTVEENKTIKEGNGKGLWKGNNYKKRQKDTDASWTRKNNETHFGYKNHVNVDRDSKMIVQYSVTTASVHDSKELVGLIGKKDKELHGDSAYVGEALHKALLEKNPNLKLKINEKGYRNRPLTEEQKASNREKSRVRARVEHVFGQMVTSSGRVCVRVIGIARATLQIGLKNLAYNMQRLVSLKRHGKVPHGMLKAC